MDYREVNEAILAGRDVNEAIRKDAAFYGYLNDNRVLDYYARHLSRRRNDLEEMVIARGNTCRERYLRTLRVLEDLSCGHGIGYALFKTHRYVDDRSPGDIDIFVREADFIPFLRMMGDAGFATVVDEPGKGKCVREGLCVIEPHANISWRGMGPGITAEDAMMRVKQVEYENGLRVPTVDPSVEVTAALAKVLYEPNYLDLHTLVMLRRFGEGQDFARGDCARANESIARLKRRCHAQQPRNGRAFPEFMSNVEYMKFWSREWLDHGRTDTYLLHTVFFFYWKYRRRLNGKLPFLHDMSCFYGPS